MRKWSRYPVIFTLLTAISVSWTSCVKDGITRTYTIFTPVYKTKAEVRANIRSNAPVDVKTPGKLFLKGRYIFLNEVDKGVHIIDNANPAKPVNVAFIDIPGNLDLAVKGNTLYADLYTDLVAIDISNPLDVKVKKVMDGVFPHRLYGAGFVANTDQVITEWTRRDTTVQVSRNGGFFPMGCLTCSSGLMVDAAMASRESKGASPFGISGSMARFTIVRNTLYTVSNNDLNLFSIAQAEDPVYTKKIQLSWGIETIYPFKDKLFIGSNTGLFIYDISNEQQPAWLSQFRHATACDPVIADDNHAFVTLRSGLTCPRGSNQLDVLDISNLTSPVLLKTYSMTSPHGLSKDDNLLFICDGKNGLKVYDASNVNDLRLLHHITGIETFDVIAYNDVAIVVEKEGIRQYDYSNAGEIKLLSTISLSH